MLFRLLVIFTFLNPGLAHAVPYEGHKLLVSVPSPHAVATARRVASRGGNVADVAVAIGLTLSVTSPYYASLGGGGFALVKYQGNDPVALDFREKAPEKTHPEYYLKKEKGSSQTGGAAVGVPGFPAGLKALHKKYGKLDWKTLFHDAIRLAEDGMEVSGEWANITQDNEKRFNESGKKHFFKNGKHKYQPGQILYQRDLAKALRLFRSKGMAGFYEGPVAHDMANSIKKTGGDLTVEDLKNYRVRWLDPIHTKFKGNDVYLMPPPSSGGVVIASALKLTEELKPYNLDRYSVPEFHMLGEILKRAFRGRALLGDPDFHKNPITRLLSKPYIAELAKSYSPKKVNELTPLKEEDWVSKESTETTHYSVMDSDGNAIALTVTVNGAYGSAVVSDLYGITLNNEMDDFTTRPGEPNMFGLVQGAGNNVQAGKRPLSSMSPSLVLKNGKTVLAVGAPGGPRIISAVYQAIYRSLTTELDLDYVVQSPRVHHQFLPETLYIDENRMVPETKDGLEKLGHTLKEGKIAKVYAVRRKPDGTLEAAFDSRGEGAAGGF